MITSLFEGTKELLNTDLLNGVESYSGYEIENIPDDVIEFCKEIKELGGRAFLVGGCVRDAVISKEEARKIKTKDFDLEIFGINPDELQKLAQQKFGNVDLVGKQFGILKSNLPQLVEALDIAVPRTEKKIASGHKGFEVIPDPNMTLKSAARRRDTTVNAMYYDPLDKKVYDPFNGIDSIKNKELRIVDKDTFIEDPLRLLRLSQFSARLEYTVSKESIEICKQMVSRGMLEVIKPKKGGITNEEEGVTRERISTEFEKLLTVGVRPSLGIEFLRDVGYLDRYFKFETPEGHQYKFTDLQKFEQDKEHHKEGNVWIHIMECLDAGADIIKKLAKNPNYCRNLNIEGRSFEQVPLFVTDAQLQSLYEKVFKSANAETNIARFRYAAMEKVLIELGYTNLRQGYDAELAKHIQEETRRRAEINKNSKIKESTNPETIRERAVVLTNMNWFYPKLQTLFDDNKARVSTEVFERYTNENKEEYITKYVTLGRKNIERDMKMAIMLGIMFHDIGKITTTKVEESGKITSRNHSEEGVKYIDQLLEIFDASIVSTETRAIIPLLIKYHMDPWMLYEVYSSGNKSAMKKRGREFKKAGGNFYLLSVVAISDYLGRKYNPDGSYKFLSFEDSKFINPSIVQVLEMAQDIENILTNEKNSKTEFILNGDEIRRVLAIPGSPVIGKIMQKLREAQDLGIFNLPGDETLPEEVIIANIKERQIAFVKQIYPNLI